jgi:amino acid adenylation domain-containing protein
MNTPAIVELKAVNDLNGAPQASRSRCLERVAPSLYVPQLVGKQAAETPQLIALVGESRSLSYAELDTQSSQLAHHLQSLGVGPSVRVGICLTRSLWNIVAALAVFKAGGAYVPLDPTYPSDRLAFILEDADVAVLLTEQYVGEVLPPGHWHRVMLDSDAPTIMTYPTVAPPGTVSREDLAYLIYTSGSTGAPKGVQITHANLLNLVRWHQSAFSITAQDRATQLASFGFDAAVWELWPYLTAGAAVHVTPDSVRNTPVLLLDWLVAEQITVSFAPTPLAEALILLDWPGETKLRLLLTGADTLRHYPRAGLPFQLINNYGPTETTVVATSALIPPMPSSGSHPTIGRPIDNTQVYICDESLNLLSPGEVGELYIGGAGVARGYVNSPELTAQKFLADPFSEKPGARLYRTGDRARLLPDGQLEYLGRVDDLIKIRGFRIEPNEIISVLNSYPGVRSSVVAAREDSKGNARLVAYVFTDDDACPSASSLRALVRKHLPEYMAPALFVKLTELPLTTNGKIDRDALPSPDVSNTLRDEQYVAPRTIIEEKLSEIVADLLGLDQVGVDDNFFLIGGHSLFGTQLIAHIHDCFGVTPPLLTIFDSATAARLGQEIERLLIAKVNAMDEAQVEAVLNQAGSAGER